MTYGLRVLPPRLSEASPDLSDVLVRRCDRAAVNNGGEVDVRAPLLPGGEMLVSEVDAGAGRVSGDKGIVARFRDNRKGGVIRREGIGRVLAVR